MKLTLSYGKIKMIFAIPIQTLFEGEKVHDRFREFY